MADSLKRLAGATVVLLALALLGGCATTGDGLTASATKAAVRAGVAEAKVPLPAWPAACRQTTPHAAVHVGENKNDAIKLEQRQVDKGNERLGWCADHYDALRAGYAR